MLKTWLFFKNIVPNKSILYIGDDFRAVCALINLYRPPRITSNEDDQEIGNLMLELSEKNNQVKTKAEGFPKNVSKNKLIDAFELNFPLLSLEYLEQLTIGTYQLKSVKRYTNDHSGPDGEYLIEYYLEESQFLRVKMKSRHSSSDFYNVYVNF